MSRLCVLVGYEDDLLLNALAEQLSQARLPVLRRTPHTLGDLCVTGRDGQFWIGEEPVGGVVFRCRPDVGFSRSFVAADQHFADTEARAVWLAALHLPSVYSVNRPDAAAWFDCNRWSFLRRRLVEQGVPVTPVLCGNRPAAEPAAWLLDPMNDRTAPPSPILQRLFGTALATSPVCGSYLMVSGAILGAEAPSAVRLAQANLRRAGITLAEIAVDAGGRVAGIDTLPAVQDDVVEQAAALLLEEYHAHLHCRRAQ